MSNNIVNRVKARHASFNMPLNQEVTMNADGSGGPISINKQTKDKDDDSFGGWSDWGHLGLDALGMVDAFGIGTAADLINAAWYTKEGDLGNAAISTAAATPGLGWGATATKWGKRINEGRKLKQKADKVLKHTDPSSLSLGTKLLKQSDEAYSAAPKDAISQMVTNLKRKMNFGFGEKQPFKRGTFGKIVDWASMPATLALETKRADDDSNYYKLGERDENYGFSNLWGEKSGHENKEDSPKKQRFNDGVAYTGRQHWKTFKK